MRVREWNHMAVLRAVLASRENKILSHCHMAAMNLMQSSKVFQLLEGEESSRIF